MPHIRFVGDAAGGEQFTHFAGHSGAIAAINALIGRFGRLKYDKLVPRVTFTSPEVASVGLTEAQAKEQNREVEVFTYSLAELDRAVIDGVGEGLVKLIAAKGKDRVLGATIVAPNAGDLIVPWMLAIKKGVGLKAMQSLIHPYPTMSEAGRFAAGEYRKAHSSRARAAAGRALEPMAARLTRILVFAREPAAGKGQDPADSGARRGGRGAAGAGDAWTCAKSKRRAANIGPVELVGDPHPETWDQPVEGVAMSAQVGADLGERMGEAVERALARGERVIVTGTDCPGPRCGADRGGGARSRNA